MRFLCCFCLFTLSAAALGCSGEIAPELGGSPLGDLSVLAVSERSGQTEARADDQAGQDDNNVVAEASEDGKTVPENRMSAEVSLPEVCQKHRVTRTIQIVNDPTMEVSYDLEMLGVVTLTDEAARHAGCLDAAIRDGAQVLTHTDGLLRIFYPTRFESYIDAAAERIDIEAVEGRLECHAEPCDSWCFGAESQCFGFSGVVFCGGISGCFTIFSHHRYPTGTFGGFVFTWYI
jgi:hypothetical protein